MRETRKVFEREIIAALQSDNISLLQQHPVDVIEAIWTNLDRDAQESCHATFERAFERERQKGDAQLPEEAIPTDSRPPIVLSRGITATALVVHSAHSDPKPSA